ncbi:MAG: ECF transporter S component [Oscillospiraceae bacterium]|nr:ECF transporter S component [Oscillospiraceae bacterium]
MKHTNIKKMVVISLFCAIAYIFVFVFRIKVSFLTFDAKDAVITVCALLYGPLSGIAVSIVVSFLEFISVSDTGVYGLIMNVLSTVAFSVPAAFIYKFRKTTLSAVSGLILSVVSMTAVMLGANLLITPFYMGVDIEAVKSLLLPLILPFNFTKALLNAGLTMLIYKPAVNALRTIGLTDKRGEAKYKLNKTTITVLIVSLIVIILSITFFFLNMGGVFEVIRK